MDWKLTQYCRITVIFSYHRNISDGNTLEPSITPNTQHSVFNYPKAWSSRASNGWKDFLFPSSGSSGRLQINYVHKQTGWVCPDFEAIPNIDLCDTLQFFNMSDNLCLPHKHVQSMSSLTATGLNKSVHDSWGTIIDKQHTEIMRKIHLYKEQLFHTVLDYVQGYQFPSNCVFI